MSSFELTDDWFHTLSANRKGEMGEALAKTHLRSIIEERPGDLFPAFEPVSPSSIYTQVRHYRRFTFEEVHEDGQTTRYQWQADLTIRLSSLYSDTHPDISRTVALEVKTGEYASLEANQRRVMGLLNESDDILVLHVRVRFDRAPLAELRYSTLESDPNTNAGFRLVDYEL